MGALQQQLTENDLSPLGEDEVAFVVILIHVNVDNIPEMRLNPGFNLWTTKPGQRMYDILNSLVGKETTWENTPEEVRNEFPVKDGTEEFDEDYPDEFAIPLL